MIFSLASVSSCLVNLSSCEGPSSLIYSQPDFSVPVWSPCASPIFSLINSPDHSVPVSSPDWDNNSTLSDVSLFAVCKVNKTVQVKLYPPQSILRLCTIFLDLGEGVKSSSCMPNHTPPLNTHAHTHTHTHTHTEQGLWRGGAWGGGVQLPPPFRKL